MKRLCLPMLLIICLLLSGCGGRPEKQQYAQFVEELSARSSLSFTAELRAEYEDKTLEFTLQFDRDDSGSTVTVLAPDIISGIKAQFAEDGSALEYDGILIATGDLDEYKLSPMSALPTIVAALENGHLDSFWTENGMAAYQLIANDELIAIVYFDADSMTPCRAELICNGKMTVCCEIENWR